MKCKACGATHESAEFYQSIKTYCKVHWLERVKSNRSQKIDYYRAYDRDRGMHPNRVASRDAYQATPAGKAAMQRARKAYRQRSPERRAAQIMVGNAVRDGRLIPWPACSHPEGCECTTVEAHHPDYSRPLDVVWLCQTHHKQVHALVAKPRPPITA